jgi:hypothetical protein
MRYEFFFFHKIVGQKGYVLEPVSKPQIRFKGKAQANEKAEHTREYVSILSWSVTQPLGLRWGFETDSTHFTWIRARGRQALNLYPPLVWRTRPLEPSGSPQGLWRWSEFFSINSENPFTLPFLAKLAFHYMVVHKEIERGKKVWGPPYR